MPAPSGHQAEPHQLATRLAALVDLAAQLAEEGVPAEVLHAQVGAGIGRAVLRHARSGR